MGEGNPGDPAGKGLSERACRSLAGLDAGVGGGLVVLFWLTIVARIQGDYWWAKLNVAGALFYGDRVYSMGWGRASLAGAAIFLILYSLLGLAYSLLARPRGTGFNLLAAMTVALLWHQMADALLWPRWNRSAPVYFHPVVMLPAHVWFGLSLLRFAPRFRRIAAALGNPRWAAALEPPAPPVPPPPETGPAEPPPADC